MLLLLMRHGIAEENPENDAARPLTEKGRARVAEVAGLLGKLGCEPRFFLSSPRRRAIETAQVTASVLGGSDAEIHQVESLDFDGTWEGFVADLQELLADSPNETVLAAGHEPNIGRFVTEALIHNPEGFHVKKGAVAALHWDGILQVQGAELRFYLTYSMVKRL